MTQEKLRTINKLLLRLDRVVKELEANGINVKCDVEMELNYGQQTKNVAK